MSCSDGGGAQLGALLEEDLLEAANNLLLTLCKHSERRTAAEQYADLTRVFKSIKSVSKTITAKNLPMGGFKKKVHDQLMEVDKKGDLSFSRDKRNCILNFIVCLPEILLRCVSTGGIMQGFVEGGAVDKETHTWPDFNKILAGCRRKVTLKEVSSIKDNFTQLYDTFSRLGKILEEVFDELGFVEDINSNGKSKPCNITSIVHSKQELCAIQQKQFKIQGANNCHSNKS